MPVNKRKKRVTLLGTYAPMVVSSQSMDSDDMRDVIDSNIDLTVMLLQAYLNENEISHDALVSYYVDYYLAQVNNGGFSQFVANTGWKPEIVALVREGLREMGAKRHAALFEQGATDVAALGDRLDIFLASEYAGENAERDELDAVSDLFYQLDEEESLEERNAQWIRARPDLMIVDEDDIPALVAERAACITNHAERVVAALDAEPEYMKLIRRLCAQAGHTLSHLAYGDHSYEHEGEPTFAWYFVTDRGVHFMVHANGKAMMFNKGSRAKLIEVAV